MTEEEWLISTDPWAMLSCYGKGSERKNRLVLLACCRLQEGEIVNEQLSAALDAAERHADGLLAASTLRKYKHRVARFRNALTMGEQLTPEHYATNLVVLAVTPFGSAGWQPVPDAIRFGIWDGDFSPRLETHLPALLRDIFGNPFRPATIDESWLRWNDRCVVKIAQAVYEERRFEDMPILADALEDAGCDSEVILAHCRGQGPHVRGCWVLDLLLKKA